MRKLFQTYVNSYALDTRTPFDGLSFHARKVARPTVPPFTADWIRDRIPAPGAALRRLKEEARPIRLALVGTGCRPSEICNIAPDNIRPSAYHWKQCGAHPTVSRAIATGKRTCQIRC